MRCDDPGLFELAQSTDGLLRANLVRVLALLAALMSWWAVLRRLSRVRAARPRSNPALGAVLEPALRCLLADRIELLQRRLLLVVHDLRIVDDHALP